MSNDDAAECRQGLLPLRIRQQIPQLIEGQRSRWARGGTRAVALGDMGLLLESQAGEFASIAATQASWTARLWASAPNSVKAKEWGHSSSCFFGLLLTDFFTNSPFVVEVERDMSVQQQLLDVAIVRRGRGRFVGRLPDGLEGLRAHNLITFKSRHEPLDGWAMKELMGLDVAYRKLVSPSPTELLPDDHFGLYAVTARFPHNLSGQVPWQQVQPGVYDCRWGIDTIRVLVAGELPREPHNAPLHLFSASPDLVGFGQLAYHRRSEQTSRLLGELFDRLRQEGFAMAFTMEDFNRQYIKKHFLQMTPEEQREILQLLPVNELLASLSPKQIQQLRNQLLPGRADQPRKSRRKK